MPNAGGPLSAPLDDARANTRRGRLPPTPGSRFVASDSNAITPPSPLTLAAAASVLAGAPPGARLTSTFAPLASVRATIWVPPRPSRRPRAPASRPPP